MARVALDRQVEERTREIERRRQVAEGLRNILAILNSDRTLDEILDHVVAQSSQLLGSDACLLYKFDRDGRRLTLEAEYGLPAGFKTSGDELPPTVLATRVVHGNQPAAISDLPAYAISEAAVGTVLEDCLRGWHRAAARYFHSAMDVPLVVRDAPYGGLIFYYRERREFSDEDFRLGESLGDHAVLAIENARLRAQAEQVAVMRERERLARDLHDSVTQSLYSLTLLAEAGRRLVELQDLGRVEEVLTRLGEVSQQALREMRLLVYQLRPLVLKREGLAGALQQRLDAVEKRAGIEARLLVEGEVKLPMGMEQELYHVAQEALNNALKHADANAVTVKIRAEGDALVLEVVDDGRGFNARSVDGEGGMGLTSMQERVERMGGELEIRSSPTEGTRVRVKVGIVSTVDVKGDTFRMLKGQNDG